MDTRQCRGYEQGGRQAHEAPASDFGARPTQCRDCHRAYLDDWRKRRGKRAPRGRSFTKLRLGDADREPVSEEDLQGRSHEYIPNPALLELWHAVVSDATQTGSPMNLMFLGESGSGKTDGAQYLAGLVSLPYVKVDAASMTDPESWFGTREVVQEDGASVTVYRPSEFVRWLQQPCVLLIDEANRIRDEHRNVVLPILDGTRRVTNPLTGETLVRDPRCFVILSGNRGLAYTGTYTMDPALMTRCIVYEFDYLAPEHEVKVAIEATGVDEAHAKTVVRMAAETRVRASSDSDLQPMSTREVISACRLIARGMKPDLAIKYTTINLASGEGGAGSPRTTLEVIWTGVRGKGS